MFKKLSLLTICSNLFSSLDCVGVCVGASRTLFVWILVHIMCSFPKLFLIVFSHSIQMYKSVHLHGPVLSNCVSVCASCEYVWLSVIWEDVARARSQQPSWLRGTEGFCSASTPVALFFNALHRAEAAHQLLAEVKVGLDIPELIPVLAKHTKIDKCAGAFQKTKHNFPWKNLKLK